MNASTPASTTAFPVARSTRFQAAIDAIDAANRDDPNIDHEAGVPFPRELLYSWRVCEWIMKLVARPDEALLLAARCQHVRRWENPRAGYPMDRPGYLKWRSDLKRFHAKTSAELLTKAGYGNDVIQQVADLNLKKNFPRDPDAQTLEDALCLVFLRHQLDALAAKTDDEKMINALRKSWGKMSGEARAWALKLQYSPNGLRLVRAALADE